MNKEEIEEIKKLLFQDRLTQYGKRKLVQYLEQKESILDKVTDKLKETIKKERELMPYLPHKSVSFHYANGREVLAKEILEFIEGEKK